MSDGPVLVTGATGFIGAEVVRQLLGFGYSVRGTTRNVATAESEGHLTSLPGADRLELWEADLGSDGAFDSAMSGCDNVIHVASPYALDVADPRRDLLEPALHGTLSVLSSAAQSGDVKRVVLTSSFVAIMGTPHPGRVFTEEDWNTEDTLESNAYPYSKTMAERAAWEFMEERRPAFDLVTINPVQVIGPTLVPRVNQTHEWFASLTNGRSPAVVAIDFPTVDVRDVALTHVLALGTSSASGRYLTSAGNMTLRRVAEIGRRLGMAEKYKMPYLTLDSRTGIAISRFALLFQPAGSRRYLRRTIGQKYEVDTSKVRRELNIEFRDLDQSIEETWIDLDSWGLLGKNPA